MSDATDGRTDEELAADVGELADALRELREELRPRRRGPFGLPAPPSPGELLRFADERAIPFAIAVLEANIRALELLQGAIRLAQSGKAAGERASRTQDRAASLGRTTLERLDGVLSDLEDAANDGNLPGRADAREVLTEARRLRDEIDDALAERIEDGESPSEESDTNDPTEIDVDGPGRTDLRDDEHDGPEVDVEGELRSIKEELGKMDDEAAPDGIDDGDGSAGDGADDEASSADDDRSDDGK